MSVIFLVRHGQASLGAADYDQLSPKGFHQSALVGAALRERGATPTSVVSGDLRRHVQTVSWAGLADAAVDPRWNEFDHKPILEAACGPIGTLGDLGARVGSTRSGGGRAGSTIPSTQRRSRGSQTGYIQP